MRTKVKHHKASTSVDLDSLGRLLSAQEPQSLKTLYQDGRRLGLGKKFKKLGKNIGKGIKKAGNGIKKAVKKIGKAFKNLTRRRKKRVMHQVVKDMNNLISKLRIKSPLGDSQLTNISLAANQRKLLLEGVKINLNPAKERCEKKFGKGECIQFGDYSYVYKCSGRQVPTWVD